MFLPRVVEGERANAGAEVPAARRGAGEVETAGEGEATDGTVGKVKKGMMEACVMLND